MSGTQSALAAVMPAAGAAPGASVPPFGMPKLPPPSDAVTTEIAEEDGAQGEPSIKDQLLRWAEMVNIAEDPAIPEAELGRIAVSVGTEYDLDENSRADWKAKYRDWMDLAMQLAEEKTYPWPQASNVIFPLITSAAIQFQARAYPAIIRDKNVVKGVVVGSDRGMPAIGPDGKPAVNPDGSPVWAVQPGAKRRRADRIAEHMSWQLLDEQPEWEPETDRLLIVLPIVGCMFRKSWFDPSQGRNVSETVSALDVCVDYKAKSFEAAPRVTETLRLLPWEIVEKIRSGEFLDDDYGHDTDGSQGQDPDAYVTFLEQHRRWDLDGDGYAEPYIITVARDTHKLARIQAAYDADGLRFTRSGEVLRIQKVEYFTKYGFIPSPDSGVYDLGFGHLLYPLNQAVNTSLNQMFDAGHLQNAGGGFVGSNLSINTGSVLFQVGEYKPVNTNGKTISESIFPLPFRGPSQVLFELVQFLVAAGKEVAAIKDIMVGDMPGDNTSGVTTLAVIEQGLQVFTAIYKRIHRALKSEYTKLYRLNRLYLHLESGYQRNDEWQQIGREEYEAGAGVEPISDPRMMTDMQRLGRAQFLMGFKDDPWFNAREVRRRMLEAAQIPDIDDVLNENVGPQAELIERTAQLHIQQQTLQIRAAHQEAEMDIRRAKDRTRSLLDMAQAIRALAEAQKFDHAAAQGWYEKELDRLRINLERENAAAENNPNPQDSPAAAAGIPNPAGAGGGAPGAGGGAGGALGNPAGAMAPPPGNQGGAGLPG